jgi:predicted nucleic acid-binding protein
MIRAFIDASVLFAGCLSARGASREIIQMGVQGGITLVVSDIVLEETRRNLAGKAPRALPFFQQLVEAIPLTVVKATKREVLRAAQYTELKDAPIVAAALRGKVDYLVSLDRKHLVGVQQVQVQSGLAIVLPEELLARIREAV